MGAILLTNVEAPTVPSLREAFPNSSLSQTGPHSGAVLTCTPPNYPPEHGFVRNRGRMDDKSIMLILA